MPHLCHEHSSGLECIADLDGFAAASRDALDSTGAGLPGGIRVRGFCADHKAAADGAQGHHFSA